MKLRIVAGKKAFEVLLDDTPTSRALLAALPFEARAQTWGEEVYFQTPVSAAREPGAKQVVDAGTVCFWTDGDAIALPYGRTPMSTDHRPKLASPCNILGTLADFEALREVKPGQAIRVEKA
ncbi:MAG TPA: cyclophilin-like fold protein [Burkholderiales bacterium]|nr:cyclophilin-like fold protein [Burkholderiales bacterium]